MKKQFLILSLLLFALACEKVQENEVVVSESEVNFCALLDAPEEYKSESIQTKAIVLDYHQFIFYNS